MPGETAAGGLWPTPPNQVEPVEKRRFHPLTTSSRYGNEICDQAVRGSIEVRTTRRSIREMIMGACSLLLLAFAIGAIEPRLREQVSSQLSAPPSAQFSTVSNRVQDISHTVVAIAREQASLHATLVMFAVAGGILTIFMLRT
jgi:hypothetical protein